MTKQNRIKASGLSITTNVPHTAPYQYSTTSVSSELSSTPLIGKKATGHGHHEKSCKHSEALSSSNWRATAQPAKEDFKIGKLSAFSCSLSSSTQDSTMGLSQSGSSFDRPASTCGNVTYFRPVAGAGDWEDVASAPHWKLQHTFGNRTDSTGSGDEGQWAPTELLTDSLGQDFVNGLCAVIRRVTLSPPEPDEIGNAAGRGPLKSASAAKTAFDLSFFDVVPCSAACDNHHAYGFPDVGFAELSISAALAPTLLRDKFQPKVKRAAEYGAGKELKQPKQPAAERADYQDRSAALYGHILADPAVVVARPSARPALASTFELHDTAEPAELGDYGNLLRKLEESARRQFVESLLGYTDAETGKPFLRSGSRDDGELARWADFFQVQHSRWFPRANDSAAIASASASALAKAFCSTGTAHYGHQKEESHDSAISMGSPSRNSALNPKAREFLSIDKALPQMEETPALPWHFAANLSGDQASDNLASWHDRHDGHTCPSPALRPPELGASEEASLSAAGTFQQEAVPAESFALNVPTFAPFFMPMMLPSQSVAACQGLLPGQEHMEPLMMIPGPNPALFMPSMGPSPGMAAMAPFAAFSIDGRGPAAAPDASQAPPPYTRHAPAGHPPFPPAMAGLEAHQVGAVPVPHFGSVCLTPPGLDHRPAHHHGAGQMPAPPFLHVPHPAPFVGPPLMMGPVQMVGPVPPPHSLGCCSQLPQPAHATTPAQPPLDKVLDRIGPPKPRCANTAAQQRYEAWIEIRKAADPSYAIQCRLRQARRAGRDDRVAV